MAVVTIHSDAQENNICHCFHFFPSICREVIGPGTMFLVFCLFGWFFNVLFYLFIKHAACAILVPQPEIKHMPHPLGGQRILTSENH